MLFFSEVLSISILAITSLKSIISNLLNRGANTSKPSPGTENARSFTEKQKAEEAVDRRDIGLGEVPLEKIVGSVGRYHDFDSQFRSKKDHEPRKLKLIKAAMQGGKPLLPVDLYKIKDEYYVPVDFDVIAKIVLERDLLSSESEVVRQFVQGKVRSIPGVTWTQTIIALASKIKTE